METRRLGRTGHLSSVVTLGTYAIGVLNQNDADRLIESALARGVNHFDVAPTYADAELRLGDYLKRHPLPDVFIGCKTQQRGKTESREQLLRTMDRLGRDRLDLYQLHAVCSMPDLEECFAAGGSMETLIGALEEGLVSNLGITGHSFTSPATHLEAIRRFPFATVMTSANLFMAQDEAFRADWQALMATCQTDDIGVHLLKATARTAWAGRTPTHATWYEPFTKQADVDRAVAWALQQPITTMCSAGDEALFGPICDAVERYRDIDLAEQETLLETVEYGSIFVEA